MSKSVRGWWHKRDKPRPQGDEDDTLEQRMQQAQEARQQGRAALERAYSQWGEVSDLAQVLHELRTRNHFSEQVKVMLQRSVPPSPNRR